MMMRLKMVPTKNHLDYILKLKMLTSNSKRWKLKLIITHLRIMMKSIKITTTKRKKKKKVILVNNIRLSMFLKYNKVLVVVHVNVVKVKDLWFNHNHFVLKFIWSNK